MLSKIWNKLGKPNMNLFRDRLLLQKKIYLLQESGFNLGYNFSFYLHGPYSSDLATDGYKMNLGENISDNNMDDPVFNKLNILEKGHENDSFWFELLATIVFLRKRRNNNKEDIRAFIIKNKPYLYNQEIFETAYNKLIQEGLMI